MAEHRLALIAKGQVLRTQGQVMPTDVNNCAVFAQLHLNSNAL